MLKGPKDPVKTVRRSHLDTRKEEAYHLAILGRIQAGSLLLDLEGIFSISLFQKTIHSPLLDFFFLRRLMGKEKDFPAIGDFLGKIKPSSNLTHQSSDLGREEGLVIFN